MNCPSSLWCQYFFSQRRQFGAPEDFHIMIFFGERDVVLIDTENVVELFPK